jgi:hypothetical protein
MRGDKNVAIVRVNDRERLNKDLTYFLGRGSKQNKKLRGF